MFVFVVVETVQTERPNPDAVVPRTLYRQLIHIDIRDRMDLVRRDVRLGFELDAITAVGMGEVRGGRIDVSNEEVRKGESCQ